VTERLYYTDSYLTDFDARVTERADDGRRVYLDRTAFYPTSGGQPHDLGLLGEAKVLDVVDEGERIAHLLSQPLSADRVAGRVDWERRFDHMQQHTGQHLLSAVLADLYRFTTVSVHFGQDTSTLDLDVAEVARGQLAEAEMQANAIVTENRPVTVGFEDAALAGNLRKPSDRQGPLRIVTIAALDRSACGGTHVRATGEIGAILIRRMERVRKAARLEFVCGRRVIRAVRADSDLLSRIGASFSAAPADLPALIDAQRAALKEAASTRRELESRLDALRARELYADAVPGVDGVRRIVLRDESAIERLRFLGQAVASLSQVVFIGAARTPPGVVVATSDDSGRDAAAWLRTVLEQVGGRGGGNARLAQAAVPADKLEAALDMLTE
jgi:alanyl-tRNA synthetase